MRRRAFHMIFGCMLLLVTGCVNQQKKTDWSVTLQKNDKRPYGSYLAFESLHYYFPQAHIEAMSRDFRLSSIDAGMNFHKEGPALLVLNGLNFFISKTELQQLFAFAENGNEVFIICSQLDHKLKDTLNCEKTDPGVEEYPIMYYKPGIKNLTALQLSPDSTNRYGMSGRSLLAHFEAQDTTSTPDSVKKYIADNATEGTDADGHINRNIHPEVLGTTSGDPDFVRYKIGSGHITLHAAPLAFSNYFLLQRNNREYLDRVWQTFPANVSHIYWDDYYKRRIQKAGLGLLLQYPGTRWALIITLITLLLYVLFESKRRQRIIPIIPKMENSSVSFAETVGRLYYNKGNHNNLAEKIIQQFMEWVRNHYYLNTNQMNETFIRQLSSKSGIDENVVRELVNMTEEIKNKQVKVDEVYLYHLHETVQRFYKNNN